MSRCVRKIFSVLLRKEKEWMSSIFRWKFVSLNESVEVSIFKRKKKKKRVSVECLRYFVENSFSSNESRVENLFPSNESRVGFHLSCCCYSCVAAKHLKKLARGFLVFVRWKIMETLRAEPQLRNALKYPFFSQSWHFRPCLFMVRGFRDFELKYQAFCDWYLILFISLLDLHLVWH